jgi:hypothetical protein
MLSSRTYNISQRRPWVGRTLLSVYIIATLVRFLSSEAMLLVLITRHSSNGFQVSFLGCVSQESISIDISTMLTLYRLAVLIDVSATLSVLVDAG